MNTEALDTLDKILTSNGGVCGHEYVHYLHGDKAQIKAKLQQYVDSECLKARVEALRDITKTSSVLSIQGAGQPVDVVGVHVINSQIKQLEAALNTGGNKGE